MSTRFALVKGLIRGQEGATLVEYALTLLLVLIVTMAAISALGSALSDFFTSAAGSI